MKKMHSCTIIISVLLSYNLYAGNEEHTLPKWPNLTFTSTCNTNEIDLPACGKIQLATKSNAKQIVGVQIIDEIWLYDKEDGLLHLVKQKSNAIKIPSGSINVIPPPVSRSDVPASQNTASITNTFTEATKETHIDVTNSDPEFHNQIISKNAPEELEISAPPIAAITLCIIAPIAITTLLIHYKINSIYKKILHEPAPEDLTTTQKATAITSALSKNLVSTAKKALHNYTKITQIDLSKS